ncbi:MAG: amino acid ABC transporter permease, partial [Pseudolabrys sp.]
MTTADGHLPAAEPRFVRQAQIESRPPPVATTGTFGWLRQNLLSTPFNIVLTILILLFLAWIIPDLLRFLFFDAVWSGTDRDACREIVQHRPIGACWPFVYERAQYFIYGSYPIPQRWRVDLFFAGLAVGVAWLLWINAPRRGLGLLYFFVV